MRLIVESDRQVHHQIIVHVFDKAVALKRVIPNSVVLYCPGATSKTKVISLAPLLLVLDNNLKKSLPWEREKSP